MKITIFGLVWILAVLYTLYRKHPKYLIGLTLFSCIFQAASVFVIGENGVGPMIVTSIVMNVWCLMTSSSLNQGVLKIKYENKVKVSSFVGIYILFAVIVISREINHAKYTMTDTGYRLLFLQLLIYAVCYINLWNLARRITKTELQDILDKIIIFAEIIGVLQLLMTTNILPRNVLATTFLYTPDTNSAYYWGAYYPRLFSTFMEPSYCGAFLVGAFYYVISNGRRKKYYRAMAIILVIEILLSFSSTAYGAFAVTGVVYILLSKNKKALRYLIPIGLCMIAALTISGQFVEILDSVIFNKINTGSWATRANADEKALTDFMESPLIGIGYKNGRASQFWASMLGQVGILGLIAWGMIWLPIVYKSIKERDNALVVAGCLFLIGTVCSMFIAIPDMDFCVFWGIMYFMALLCGEKNMEREAYIYGK